MAKKRFVTPLSPTGWKAEAQFRRIAQAGGESRGEMLEYLLVNCQQQYADYLKEKVEEELAPWNS